MIHCPECEEELDIDPDDFEEGETLSCPECETDLEVVSTSPFQLVPIDEDYEDEDDDLEDEDE